MYRIFNFLRHYYTNISISRRLWLMTLVSLVCVLLNVLVNLAYVWDKHLYASHTLKTAEKYRLAERTINDSELHFKLQVQEWKDLLLRGHSMADFIKYWMAFEHEEQYVQRALEQLINLMNEISMDSSQVIELKQYHLSIGSAYRNALLPLKKQKLNIQQATKVDAKVREIDRDYLNKSSAIIKQIYQERNNFIRSYLMSDKSHLYAYTFFFVLFLISTFFILFSTILVRRSIIKPVKETMRIFDRIQEGHLHNDIAQDRRDEIGELWRHLNHMQKTISDQNDSLRDSLQAKEILLQEVLHRVKNNLQVVSSLLNLQMSYIEGKPEAAILQESRDRINVMSLIHEKIYNSKNVNKISISNYTKSLVKDMLFSYGYRGSNIKINIGECNAIMGMNQLVPYFLILHELVSNSLKYAFTDDIQNPQLEIHFLHNKEKNVLKITVHDNGIGFQKGYYDIDNPSTLGLEIVKAFVQQIDGDIKLMTDNQAGTKCEISFTLENLPD